MNLKSFKVIDYSNLFFCLSIMFSSLVSLFCGTIRFFVGSTKSLDTLLMYGMLSFVIIKVLPSIINSINKKDLLFFFILALAFVVSFFSINNNISISKQVIIEIFSKCLFTYFGAKLVHYSPTLNKYLRISAYIVILSVFANTYIFGIDKGAYSQYDGYLLLNSMALLYVPLFTENKIYDYLVSIIVIILALLTGARGPFLICSVLFVSGFFIGYKNKKYRIIRLAIPIISIGIVGLYLKEILLFISVHVGDSSSMRTIRLLLNNEFMESSGRISIMACAIDYIKDHLLFGCGVVNDRTIIWQSVSGFEEAIGCYPHNFFLEIGMQFGLFPGLLVSIFFIYVVAKRFFRSTCINNKLFIVALFFAGFAPLMLSGSYLSWALFYSIIGFLNKKKSL